MSGAWERGDGGYKLETTRIDLAWGVDEEFDTGEGLA
jgi:hypothetical protein